MDFYSASEDFYFALYKCAHYYYYYYYYYWDWMSGDMHRFNAGAAAPGEIHYWTAGAAHCLGHIFVNVRCNGIGRFSQVGFVVVDILYNWIWFISGFCGLLSSSLR